MPPGQSYRSSVSEIIFEVQEDTADGGFVATALGHAIVTQGDTLDELRTMVQHPDVRAFLAEDRFLTYRIEHGNLIWGDYDLCFPVADLHANAIHPVTRSAAA